ncbi:hypothetical protein HPB52_012080 [Rhipicephalus sanguineus]|uniref:HTH psq-type domain-containing protein n=1 Tax=Rhipicephalus sanguineus TaxID=34632 RepID=A0A9D4Q0M4_RHISA|nr:hypothetical protein HPB52_012080 [Rhipicephalus sanguineus]
MTHHRPVVDRNPSLCVFFGAQGIFLVILKNFNDSCHVCSRAKFVTARRYLIIADLGERNVKKIEKLDETHAKRKARRPFMLVSALLGCTTLKASGPCGGVHSVSEGAASMVPSPLRARGDVLEGVVGWGSSVAVNCWRVFVFACLADETGRGGRIGPLLSEEDAWQNSCHKAVSKTTSRHKVVVTTGGCRRPTELGTAPASTPGGAKMASLQTAYRRCRRMTPSQKGARKPYLIHTVPDSSPTNVCDSRGNRNSPLSSYHMNHTHMNIDENGEFSIGSDHNRIKLSFSRSSWRTIAKEHRNPAERHLPQSEYAAVAEAFEQNFQPTEPPTYDQFVLELRSIMKKHEIRVNSRGGLRRKGWWDEEVQRALTARRTANRLHRAAVRTSPGEECMSTWEEYLRLKREMRLLCPRAKFSVFGHWCARKLSNFWLRVLRLAMSRNRKPLTLGEKLRIIEEAEKRNGATKASIARDLNIPESSLKTILAKKDSILLNAAKFGLNRKAAKDGKYAAMEKALVEWLRQARSSGIAVDGAILKEKAETALRLNRSGACSTSEAALPVDGEPEFGSLELPGSFADYVGADDDVAVCSEVSLDDIIETVRPDTAGTSDEEEMDDAAEASVSVPT